MRIHLVDGTYELFRSHFGSPPKQGRDGTEVGGATGLLFSLAALIREPETTHLAVAFDHVIESFRNRMFEGYKSGEGVPEELLAQFALAERVASALGLVVWSMIEFEADDALAAGAAKYGDLEAVDQVVLCSPDKDLTQCVVGNRIVCLDRRRGITLDAEGVQEKFGVEPSSMPDWLGLVGDSADGIPGIARWGAKSTAIVLGRYGALEDIPARVEDWDIKVRGAATLAANLQEDLENAKLYKQLATLDRDVYLQEDLEDLQWQGVDEHELEQLEEVLEISNLRQRIRL